MGGLILAFDTETTGMVRWKDVDSHSAQPNIIQLGAILSDQDQVFAEFRCLVNPSDVHPDWVMEDGAVKVHGITREAIEAAGIPTLTAMRTLTHLMDRADTVVCHNVDFDRKLAAIALTRGGDGSRPALQKLATRSYYCTMKKSTDLCKIPSECKRNEYKWPRLLELHQFLFGETFDGAHDAMEDVRATVRCYREMRRLGL